MEVLRFLLLQFGLYSVAAQKEKKHLWQILYKELNGMLTGNKRENTSGKNGLFSDRTSRSENCALIKTC